MCWDDKAHVTKTRLLEKCKEKLFQSWSYQDYLSSVTMVYLSLNNLNDIILVFYFALFILSVNISGEIEDNFMTK
jgi:hypothetical protein